MLSNRKGESPPDHSYCWIDQEEKPYKPVPKEKETSASEPAIMYVDFILLPKEIESDYFFANFLVIPPIFRRQKHKKVPN